MDTLKSFNGEIIINLKFLEKNNLSVNEYLTLLKIYLFGAYEVIIPFSSELLIVEALVRRGLLDRDTDNMFSLSEIALSFFETQGNNDLFEEFYKTFPSTVPDGTGGIRPVSTSDVNGKGAQKTKQIWKKMLKNNIEKQKFVIECLKTELENRKKTGKLMYLHNIDTWLRQADWEKWESIVNKDKGSDNNTNSIIRI